MSAIDLGASPGRCTDSIVAAGGAGVAAAVAVGTRAVEVRAA